MTATCRKCGPVTIWRRAEGVYVCLNRMRDVKQGHMLTRYGITAQEYRVLYEAQEGLCLVCRSHHEVLHVDHCHDTNRVRGLLCGTCNRGLGLFYDNPELLQRAADYLVER